MFIGLLLLKFRICNYIKSKEMTYDLKIPNDTILHLDKKTGDTL